MLGMRIGPHFKSLRGHAQFQKIVAAVRASALP